MTIVNPTLTTAEAVVVMREAGFHISIPGLIAGLEQGKYPFGTVIEMEQRKIEIYTLDLKKWIRSKTIVDDTEEIEKEKNNERNNLHNTSRA